MLQALKEYSADEAKVIRSGQIGRIHASELVPGDIISVAVGDKIPADCRLLSVSSSSFRVDQAILTGESTSVNKSPDSVPDIKAVKQDMTNILFSVKFRNSFREGHSLIPHIIGHNCCQRQCESYRRLHRPTDGYWRHPQVHHFTNF